MSLTNGINAQFFYNKTLTGRNSATIPLLPNIDKLSKPHNNSEKSFQHLYEPFHVKTRMRNDEQ